MKKIAFRRFLSLMVSLLVLALVAGIVIGPRRLIHAIKTRIAGPHRHSVGAETADGWVKSATNPVLGGDLGVCFDVCLLKEGDVFRMWFSWRTKKSLGISASRDGVHWSPPQIVLAPTTSGWEDEINRPVVIKQAGLYRMWYTGQAKGHSWIGYATSPDGVAWQRVSPTPVLSPTAPWEGAAVMCPDVLWDENRHLYRMWYSGGAQNEPNAMGYATSTDGVHWQKHPSNPIFGPDKSHRWEQDRATGGMIVRDGEHYLMFYIGFEDEQTARIGLARSADGITNWERYPANPIISPSNVQSAWDYDAVYRPFVIRDGALWRLWYNGRRATVEQIGLAAHDGSVLWQRGQPTRQN